MFAVREISRELVRKQSCLHRHFRCAIKLTHLSRLTSASFGQFRSSPLTTSISDHSVGYPRRHLSSSSLVEGNLIRCPLPDIDIPDDLPLHDLIFQKCDQFGDKIAFEEYETGRKMTYTELKSRVLSVASALSRLGLVKGDVILVCSVNNMDSPVLNLACSVIGLWFATVNNMSLSDDISRYISETQPKLVFCSTSVVPMVQDAIRDSPGRQVYVFGEHPDFPSFDSLLQDDGQGIPEVLIDTKQDVLGLPFSSGTSGLPKGVMISNHSITANIMQSQTLVDMQPDDRVLGQLPFYHIYGLVVVQLAPLYVGGTVVVTSKFTPESFLQCLQDEKITFAPVVPPLLLLLAKSPVVMNYDLSSVKKIMCGAAPLGQDLITEFQARFPHVKLLHAYGMTEVIVASCTQTDHHLDSVGCMVPNTLGKVVDPTTLESLGPNENGEFMLKGPQVCKGYYNKPEATAEILTEDGWLHTGDIGYYTEDGLLYITDRLKEFIKYKGHQVAPAELEDLLLGHPDIQDAGVTRAPDRAAGEVPRAFVVKRPGSELTEEDVVNFIKGKTSPEKWLRGGVQFIDEVPKSPSGKILRRLLREKYIA